MSGGSVLIVDSDRASVRQLTDLMADFPLEVYVAFSKAEAIELSLRCSFDLCLVAHGLADGNGLSLFAEALHQRGLSRGVLISRHADLRVIVDALDAGFAHVMTYPLEGNAIRLIVAELFPGLECSCECHDGPCERNVPMMAGDDVPDLKSIASLSMNAIRFSMSTADLIRIIRSVDYPFAGKERLEYFDRDTLERVVCLVRRWSQQRLAAIGKSMNETISASDSELHESEVTTPIRVPA